MTLDEGYVSTYELMRRTEEQDREQYRREQVERDECESVEAEEQKFIRRRQARPDWYDRIHWERDVPDRDPVERPPL